MLSQMLLFGHLHPKYVIFAQNMSSSHKKGNLSEFDIPQKLHFFGENDIFWVMITYLWQTDQEQAFVPMKFTVIWVKITLFGVRYIIFAQKW